MKEEKIAAILVGETKTVNIRFPKNALDRMVLAMRKKEPTRKDYGLINHTICYFSARGLLDWEDEHREDGERKKPSRRSFEG